VGGFRGHTTSLILGLAGAGAAALFISFHWSIALAGVVAVLVLSAMESEPFILLVILLTPLGWVLPVNTPGRNVPVSLRFLIIVGFFAGRLWRGQVHVRHLFRPMVSRASLLFLCAAAAPTILGGGQRTYQFERALYTLGTFVGFYFVVLAWANSRQRIRRVLWAVMCSAIATATYAFYQQIRGGYTSLWLYLYPPDEISVPWEGRSTSFLNHPNFLACYLNLVLPLALACYVLGQGRWKKLGGWTLGLGFLTLLSTQSIGGALGFASILVLAIFCFVRSRKKKLVLLAGLCSLVCLCYLIRPVLNPVHTEGYIGNDAFTRGLLWVAAWGEFLHSPILGVGWGNFAAPFDWDIPLVPRVAEPHSVYFQLLAETGLVGFTAFLYLVVQSWRQARSQWRSSVDFLDRALAFGVLGALLSLLVHGFVDFPLAMQVGTLLWMLLALLVASGRIQCKSAVGRVGMSEPHA
jgi:putative inorganic carbon (HCO3(-)) transporter